MNENIRLDIGKAVSDAIAVYKSNMLGIILMVVLSAIVGALCCGLGTGAAMIASGAVLLRLVDKECESVSAGDGVKGLFGLIVPGLIISIFGGLGTILCGVGVFLTMPVALFAMLRVADKPEMGAVDAIKETFGKIKECKLWVGVILAWLASSLISGIGGLLCGVGTLVTMPLGLLVLVHCYRQIFPKA